MGTNKNDCGGLFVEGDALCFLCGEDDWAHADDLEDEDDNS